MSLVTSPEQAAFAAETQRLHAIILDQQEKIARLQEDAATRERYHADLIRMVLRTHPRALADAEAALKRLPESVEDWR